jgi:hypothetical protein
MHLGPAPAAHPARPRGPPARSSQPNAPNPSARPQPPSRVAATLAQPLRNCRAPSPRPGRPILRAPRCPRPHAPSSRARPPHARSGAPPSRSPAATTAPRAATLPARAAADQGPHAHPLLQPSLLPLRRELDSQLAQCSCFVRSMVFKLASCANRCSSPGVHGKLNVGAVRQIDSPAVRPADPRR